MSPPEGAGSRDDIAVDAVAVERVLGGDAEAFAPMVRRYLQPAYNVAYRLLGNRQDAEDLVQEAFLTALANLLIVRPLPAVRAVVLSHRMDPRTQPAEVAGPPSRRAARDGTPPWNGHPSVDAERSDLAETVLGALAELPERQRLIVQLFDLDGFSGGGDRGDAGAQSRHGSVVPASGAARAAGAAGALPGGSR